MVAIHCTYNPLGTACGPGKSQENDCIHLLAESFIYRSVEISLLSVIRRRHQSNFRYSHYIHKEKQRIDREVRAFESLISFSRREVALLHSLTSFAVRREQAKASITEKGTTAWYKGETLLCDQNKSRSHAPSLWNILECHEFPNNYEFVT